MAFTELVERLSPRIEGEPQDRSSNPNVVMRSLRKVREFFNKTSTVDETLKKQVAMFR